MAQAQTKDLTAQASAQLVTLRDHVARMQPEFAKALPGHITPERFVRTAQTAIALTRNIDKVRSPQSLLAACTKAAADGLILDGREAALVVDYNGDVQYRPMMRGLLKLAHQSGAIKSLVVETVRDADVFVYSPTKGDEPIHHEIDLKSARGEVYAVYALAELMTGGLVFEVMTTEDVNRIRDRSDAYRAFKAGKIKSTPWSTDWSEMARKTVFRRLSKYLPSSTEQDRLQQAAERIDEDYALDNDQADTPAAPPATTKKRGAAAAALKDVTPKQQPHQEQQADEHDPDTGEVIEHGEVVGPNEGYEAMMHDEHQPGDDI